MKITPQHKLVVPSPCYLRKDNTRDSFFNGRVNEIFAFYGVKGEKRGEDKKKGGKRRKERRKKGDARKGG